jgi:WXG100 family type VII secretion target
MANARFAVERTLLGNAVVQVDNTHQTITAQLNKMGNELLQLLNTSTFQGQFQGSYDYVITQWNQDVAKLNTALLAVRDILKSNHANYNEVDVDQNTAIQALSPTQVSHVGSVLNPGPR